MRRWTAFAVLSSRRPTPCVACKDVCFKPLVSARTNVLERITAALGWPDPGRLYPLHAARRALLRARLALSHLVDAEPRQPEQWAPLATRYLALAEQALDRISAG